MNIIWVGLIVLGVLFSIFTGNLNAFTTAMFDGCKAAVEVSLFLAGIVSLWLGIMQIVEDSGLIHKISAFFQPVVCYFFGDVPKDHPAISSITLNILANFFGLGNAATPFGIKAMQELQTLNTKVDVISFDMMLFVLINTASIQFIPFTVIGILSQFGSKTPTLIVLPTILTTFLTLSIIVTVLFLIRRIFR